MVGKARLQNSWLVQHTHVQEPVELYSVCHWGTAAAVAADRHAEKAA